MEQLSPEHQLILNCARIEMEKEVFDSTIKLIKEGVDWNKIFETAKAHNVAPLMQPNIKKLSQSSEIPADILRQFRKQYHTTWIRNQKMYDELAILLKAFNENGIEVMLIKGAALALTVYKNIGLRPMGDADILIKKEDAAKVKEIFLDNGYSELIPLKRKVFSEFTNALLPFKKKDSVIEAKWKIDYFPQGLKPDFNAYKNSSEKLRISENISSLAVSSIDSFYLTYYHLKKHEPVEKGRLIWYCDLIETKRAFRLKEPIGNDVNPGKILKENVDKKDISGAISRMSFDVKSVDGLKNKVIYILGSLFPDKNYLSYRYDTQNPVIIYLYFFLRPFSGILKMLKSVFLTIRKTCLKE